MLRLLSSRAAAAFGSTATCLAEAAAAAASGPQCLPAAATALVRSYCPVFASNRTQKAQPTLARCSLQVQQHAALLQGSRSNSSIGQQQQEQKVRTDGCWGCRVAAGMTLILQASAYSCCQRLVPCCLLTLQTAACAWQSLQQQSRQRLIQPPLLQQHHQQQRHFFSSNLPGSSLGIQAWQQQQQQQQQQQGQQHVWQQWQQQRGLLGVAKPKNYQQHNKKKPKKYKIKTPP
jgi:hypothetical protein